MCSALAYVRFTPESDIKCDIMECPFRANSGHSAGPQSRVAYCSDPIGFFVGAFSRTVFTALSHSGSSPAGTSPY